MTGQRAGSIATVWTGTPCPVCDSERTDSDLDFADGTGRVCPDCDSNIFKAEEVWQ